jgi:hypothetical protein
VNKHLGLIIGILFAAVLLFGLTTPSNIFAGSSTCPTGSISNKTVSGSLSVTSDCRVQNSVIEGGIDQTGGFLVVCGSTIEGGVKSTGGTSAVFGEINGANGNCRGDQINGGVSVSGVSSSVEFDQDTINGGAELDNNPAFVEVEGTIINGSLNCTGNSSVGNDEGGPNTIHGAETGQCAGL